jgi:hypothetical protein
VGVYEALQATGDGAKAAVYVGAENVGAATAVGAAPQVEKPQRRMRMRSNSPGRCTTTVCGITVCGMNATVGVAQPTHWPCALGARPATARATASAASWKERFGNWVMFGFSQQV